MTDRRTLEQNVDMHAHMSQSNAIQSNNGEGSHAGLLDTLSDTLLNAFAKVRKPDAKFLEIREHLEKFEESLTATERIMIRNRNRTSGELITGRKKGCMPPK